METVHELHYFADGPLAQGSVHAASLLQLPSIALLPSSSTCQWPFSLLSLLLSAALRHTVALVSQKNLAPPPPLFIQTKVSHSTQRCPGSVRLARSVMSAKQERRVPWRLMRQRAAPCGGLRPRPLHKLSEVSALVTKVSLLYQVTK